MTRLLRALVASLIAVLVLGACGEGEPEIGTDGTTPMTNPEDGTDGDPAADDGAEEAMVFTTDLTGAAETPEPGDPDGSGTAKITIKTSTNEICFELSVTGIDEANAAHIHKGDQGSAGPIVVELTPPAGGSSEGCTAVEAEVANEIAVSPLSFYVNVHNAAFPKGAVRGQLAPA